MRLALFLAEEGFNQSQIGRLTGIPRCTVGDWVRLGPPDSRPGRRRRTKAIDPAAVPPRAYSYLLGLYLGDGYICRMARTWRLRIALDSRYPGIIEGARSAIAAGRDASTRGGSCSPTGRSRPSIATLSFFCAG